MQIEASAKINLALDVITRRADGYHQVDMVLQSIELSDQVTLEPAAGIELICNPPGLPVDERNLAWRAARLLQETLGISKGVSIKIEKKIPIAAGLAGGSADAAAVLIGLNDLWELGLSQLELMRIGVRLGADVPFCIKKGTARAEGIGERLTTINSSLMSKVLLVTPNCQVSTAQVYQGLKIERIKKHPHIPLVISALEAGDRSALYAAWGNVLEEAVLMENPLVMRVKAYFKKFGISNCLMSGSGPSVFALDPPEEIINNFLAELPTEWFGCLTGILNN
jgi:4-diphosphocytidyl-2-C-methyl-D-erythritol kinase